MKIEVNRYRAFGSSSYHYEAIVRNEAGDKLIEANGPTRKLAKEAAEAEILAILESYNKRAYYPAPNGALFVVSFQYSGWGYVIVSPEGKPGCSCGVGDSFEEACEAAESHAAGYGA